MSCRRTARCSSTWAPSARRISRASSACSKWSASRTPTRRPAATATRFIAAAATRSPTTTLPPAMADREPRVPVLTEIVADSRRPRATMDAATIEALALELERAVLMRLAPEVDRLIEEKFARTLGQVLGQALDGVRAELTISVTQMVREAVQASVAQALSLPEQK